MVACYLVFKPFLVEILAAAILVSIFHAPYEWLTKALRGRKNLASLIMCLLIVLIVVIPLINLIIYSAQRSVVAYTDTINFLNQTSLSSIIDDNITSRANLLGVGSDSLRSFLADIAQKSSDWLVDGATNFLKSTTSFFISLLIIVLTMFFFFVDGQRILEKIMYWTPLPNKYDREIFKKFRDVSYSTMISTFVVAIVQGLVGTFGFIVVGLPAFFPGVLMGFLSLLPYIGAGFVWFPAGIYLLFIGKIWQGVFLLIWGIFAVSMIDNVVRAYIIKGKAQIHPILIILSIFGGISLFGFWGVFLGPLIISIAITVLHIYELEYGEVLEK